MKPPETSELSWKGQKFLNYLINKQILINLAELRKELESCFSLNIRQGQRNGAKLVSHADMVPVTGYFLLCWQKLRPEGP